MTYHFAVLARNNRHKTALRYEIRDRHRPRDKQSSSYPSRVPTKFLASPQRSALRLRPLDCNCTALLLACLPELLACHPEMLACLPVAVRTPWRDKCCLIRISPGRRAITHTASTTASRACTPEIESALCTRLAASCAHSQRPNGRPAFSQRGVFAKPIPGTAHGLPMPIFPSPSRCSL